ncbi:protein-methionine sulfoxide oxidase mical3b-like [Neosynchiropus ocellatus]
MGDPECRAQELFDEFVTASTCRAVLRSFSLLCDYLQLDPRTSEKPLYRPIKRRLNYWKANALWAKLDRRAAQPEYQQNRACSNTTCVVIGAGPCGLRTAVELSFLGARVVLLEKRDSFSRNNVLHLWPFTIHDLRGLGAKKFYGKFCAGSIDHISIRQLQLVLLKVVLLLGVEVHVNVEFKQLVEPPRDQPEVGWRMKVLPKSHSLNQLEFDAIIGADGRRNTLPGASEVWQNCCRDDSSKLSLPGFRRKEFRGKLAIAITANFKNRNSTAEAKVEEISGVAFIFNQRFFQDLRQETGIDLENIVYYKDDTHYFVMTAKKHSLLDKGVILQDFADTEQLLSQNNVDQKALQVYARKAADFSTNHQLPCLDFAINHYGQPDVAMFDFTCMYASENAAMVVQRNGHQLLVTLVGDSLLEPFWPMGTGVARGFLAALDSSWMIRRWALGDSPLDILAERESIYRLLPQTTPENMQKNIALYSLDPTTRYLNIQPFSITPDQVRHLFDTGQGGGSKTDDIMRLSSPRFCRQDSFSESNKLLEWCQEQTRGYQGVSVKDLTTSWKSGMALCALIHRYRPDLVDFESLDQSAVEENIHFAFEVSEREFGISPLMTVEELLSAGELDSLSMVMYLSQFYQLLKDAPPTVGYLSKSADVRAALIIPAFLLSRLGHNLSRKRNQKESREALGKKGKTDLPNQDEEVCFGAVAGSAGGSRVRLMANQIQAKLEENSSSAPTASRRQQGELTTSLPVRSQSTDDPALPWRPTKRTQQQQQMSFRFKEKVKSQSIGGEEKSAGPSGGGSTVCFFCRQRVYVMERLSAEGHFFHRSCFQCDICRCTLRLAAYTYHAPTERFYCLQHDSALSPPTVKRRSILSERSARHRTSLVSVGSAHSRSSADTQISGELRRSSVFSVMEAGRRLEAMPERIELENRSSSTKVEMLEEGEEGEISEEMLNRVNLSLDEKLTNRSSSESDTEMEQSRQHHDERSRAAWREALQLQQQQQNDAGEGDDKEDEDDEEYEDGEEGDDDGSSELDSSDECHYSFHSMLSSNTSMSGPRDSTPMEPDSSSDTHLSCTSTPETLPYYKTPSTASFVSTPDSTTSSSLPDPCKSVESLPPPHITPVVLKENANMLLPAVGSRRKDSYPDFRSNSVQPTPWPAFTDKSEARKNQGASLSNVLLKGLQEGEVGGARPMWKRVLSERKKKKRRVRASLPVKDKWTRDTSPGRAPDATRSATPNEESDLDSSTILKRCSMTPRDYLCVDLDLSSGLQSVSVTEDTQQEPAYVPHALAFKRAYAIKRRTLKKSEPPQHPEGQSSCSTVTVGVLVEPKEASSLSVIETIFQKGQESVADNQDARITRRVQRAARRQAKQEELKRLHKAQMIQRKLQQVEEKQRQLEERGVMVERTMRGEADFWGDSTNFSDTDIHLGGLGKLENPALMQQWFQLVQQKNALVRYESELMIFAREIQLEDKQSRLQQELRERMVVDDHSKKEAELVEERLILEEMLEVVEQRNALVSLLEEQRLQGCQEDRDLEAVMMSSGAGLNWS